MLEWSRWVNLGEEVDFNKIMQQAQQLQKKLSEAQEKNIDKIYEGISGGGQVIIRIKIVKAGEFKVDGIKIAPELFSGGNEEILEDLIIAAFNDSIKKMNADSNDAMSDLGGMMGSLLPPGLKL